MTFIEKKQSNMKPAKNLLRAAESGEMFRPFLVIAFSLAAIAAFLYFTTRPGDKLSQTEVVATTTDPYDVEHIKALTAISENCVGNYEAVVSTSTDNFAAFSDFTGLHPLSYYTCGDFSDVQTMTFPDGKHLYFVAVDTSLSCASDGCMYMPLLEVTPGNVKHIRGFNSYSYDGDYGWAATSTPYYHYDTDGAIFGFLTFQSKNGLVIAYERDSSTCGIENIYQVTDDKFPPLFLASYDTCDTATPTALYVNTTALSALTKYIDVGTFRE